MDLNRVTKKILANYATGTRGDLAISDFQKINNVTAHLLIEFNDRFGAPTGSDIENYFTKTFSGTIKPVMASCTIKPCGVSVVAKMDVETMEMDKVNDKKRFTEIIASTIYLDNNLKDTWEVREEGGRKVLSKVGTEDISSIIAERKNRLFMSTAPKMSFDSLAMLHASLLPKDVVKVVTASNEIADMTITGFSEDGFVGTIGENEVEVSKESVLDLVQASTEVRAEAEASKLEKYYTEAYGSKEYAKALVKGAK